MNITVNYAKLHSQKVFTLVLYNISLQTGIPILRVTSLASYLSSSDRSVRVHRQKCLP